jgi:hypothetical protein
MSDSNSYLEVSPVKLKGSQINISPTKKNNTRIGDRTLGTFVQSHPTSRANLIQQNGDISVLMDDK